MISAAIPENEALRIQALNSYQILDTPQEEDYNDLVKLASNICQTPISTITLIDSHRQWHKAKVGMSATESSRDSAFCAHAILQDDLMVVKNSAEDVRFFDNPFVTSSPDIKFYAGMPLNSEDGYKIGTICVIDTIPRDLNDFQREALKTLGKQVENHLNLRLHVNNLNEQKADLTRMNDVYKRLLSIIGHDLRSPLSSLTGLIELYESDELNDAEFKQFVPEIKQSLVGNAELLDTLLEWGITQIKGQSTSFANLDLHKLANDVIISHQQIAQNKSNILINEIPENLHFKGDLNMIRFIFRNLITNAIKFTNKGSIRINAFDEGEFLKLIVKDTGVGMTEAQKNKLFNWDTRNSTTGTSNEKGSGFGLLVADDFVQKHGGQFSVESTVGVGSQFIFTLSKTL